MATPAKAFYTGLYRHAFDDKNRVTIPSAWRATHAEDETFLAVPQLDGSIAVLPPSEVEKLHAKVSQIALSDEDGQDFAASFFSETEGLTFDKQGRVSLTPELLARAGITKEAVLVGSLSKFSIYSPERWSQLQTRSSGEKRSASMRRFGI